jgi:hypothetical protein
MFCFSFVAFAIGSLLDLHSLHEQGHPSSPTSSSSQLLQESHNQFVISCREYIAFGGSEEFGTNALRIDSDLRVSLSSLSLSLYLLLLSTTLSVSTHPPELRLVTLVLQILTSIQQP